MLWWEGLARIEHFFTKRAPYTGCWDTACKQKEINDLLRRVASRYQCRQRQSRAYGRFARRAKRIALAITGKFGLDISVIVKSAAEFAAVVQGNAQANATDHSQLFAVFAQEAEALDGLTTLTPLVVPPEVFSIGPHAAYLHCAGGVLKSKAGAALLGKVGRSVTTRNWATTLRLQALLQALA